MSALHIAPDFELPIDAVTSTHGILAKKGAGKSNAAVVMAEEMFKVGVPWVAIDPKGDWWGMRSSADGQSPGIPLVVFGGRHGDIPLEPTAGALIADLVVTNRLTCILDVSEFSKADLTRFLTAFGDRLYRQATDEPLHLFLEEAHEYLPQLVRNDEARCVGVWQKIVKWGRTKGLGITLVSQRSASLNKDVLTQVDTLIVLRTTSPQDRAAVKAWVDVHETSAGMLHDLPSLANGEAYVWSPEFLGLLEKIRFRQRETFDSGATPKVGEVRRPPATLADVDLAAIKEAMAETIEKVAADDPKLLRKRIADLEAKLRATPTHVPVEVEKFVEVEKILEVVPTSLLRALEALVDCEHKLDAALAHVVELAAGFSVPAPPSSKQPAPKVAPPAPRPTSVAPPAPRTATPAGTSALTGPMRKLLVVLATYGPRTKRQLALQAGYSENGGGFNNPLGALRSQGYVLPGQPITISDHGTAALGEFDPLPTGQELLDHWMSQLPGPAAKILAAIAARHPGGGDKETIAADAGYNAAGGGFNNPLGRLRTLGLVTRGSTITLTDEFAEAVGL